MGLSPVELAVIVVVIVLLFGVKRLPELGSGMGQAISNFKKSYKDATAIEVAPKGDASKTTAETEKSNTAASDSNKV